MPIPNKRLVFNFENVLTKQKKIKLAYKRTLIFQKHVVSVG